MPQPSWRDTDDDGGAQLARPSLPGPTRAVRWLLIANAVVHLFSFALYLMQLSLENSLYDGAVRHLKLAPDDWIGFFAGVPLWQLFTYGFLHDVTDVFHILGNMLILYFFGNMLEGLIGTRRFVLTYFVSMVVGALFFLVPGIVSGALHERPQMTVLGASGACLGILLALATLRPSTTVVFLFIPITLRILALLIVVGLTLMPLMLELASGKSNGIAHLVHLGGIVYGFVAAKTGLIWWDPVDARARRRAVKLVERAASDDQRMDEILAKIHREGMNTLSRAEKDFLKRMSARR